MSDIKLRSVSLEDKYAVDTTRAYMTGIEALVRLPILQHQRDIERGLNTAGFISGYRGSPLGGVDQTIVKARSFLDKHNIVFQPGINEDLAATAVWGSQQVNLLQGAKYDGVFGMWYGKGPGVDRSMDAIRHANAFGTSKYGGVLAVAGDDHAAKSSTLPHQSEHMFIGASIPILNPANVQEVLDLGIYGWELSRYCGAWVALKVCTDNMDSAISAEINPQRIKITIPDSFVLPEDGVHGRLPDTPLDQEIRLNKFKIYAAREFARANNLNRIVRDSDNPRLGIITTGKSYLDVMQALEDLGIDDDRCKKIGLRVFKVGMSWPLDPFSTHKFAQGLEEILVVEEKRSIMEDQLTGQLYNWPVDERPQVYGEFDEAGADLLPNVSELTPAMVARAIASRLSRFYRDDVIEARLKFYRDKEEALAAVQGKMARKPHYCSGCPHSRSTRIPEGSIAMGGIGCHLIGVLSESDDEQRQAYGYTQMGGEGVNWVGQAPFTETNHVFQNLGDGTYFHSGLLAIRQSVASNVNITYKILYNDAVAMTGGQQVDGALSVGKIVDQLRGEGVKRIALIAENPDDHKKVKKFSGLSINPREDLISIEKELATVPGTTILIFDQTCAAEKRRRRKKGLLEDPKTRVFINSELCEGCGDCSLESNCLSVIPLVTELGRKRQIDQDACNKDYSCLNGFCPSLITVRGSIRKPITPADSSYLQDLPEPNIAPVDLQPWNIVITGVGGTGVLTIAGVIAMAAHLEGKGCATMNQTGLAQKFGAVVSHVRVGKTQEAINAVRIPAGDADLLFGCDLVVASSDESIAKVDKKRSHAVVNEQSSITGEFITNGDSTVPVQEMKSLINREVGEDKVEFIPVTSLARKLLGDSIASNMIILGYATQKGLIPVSVSAIEEAISLNGVSVESSLRAFAWGRSLVVNSSAKLWVADATKEPEPLTDLKDIVEDRYKRLISYQSVSYANQYSDAINIISDIEKNRSLPLEFTTRAAKSLYKLMAYKDEYEVARLHASSNFKDQIHSVFENNPKLNFYLAPPIFSRRDEGTGKPKKIRLPGVMLLFFGFLARLKFLRGSRFDMFGYSMERRQERDTLNDFKNQFLQVARELTEENYSLGCELADLPLDIKGFGHIKAANLKEVLNKRDILMAKFKAGVITLKEQDSSVVERYNP